MASFARRLQYSSLCGGVLSSSPPTNSCSRSHSSSPSSPSAASSSFASSASLPYPTRIEKVKFGIPLLTVCTQHNDIPGPLLVMILKLNKEAPFKKDVFRAPGHHANMKKLVHFLQNGRLVNIDNYSVYTIASVLKKFLRKIPGGIFGERIERKLFEIIEWNSVDDKRTEIQRLLLSLPLVTQHLLVLLFGTFRAIASSSERANTGMTSEAIGVSVAPSFFHSCVADGSKFAKMEDVSRFKIATTIMKFLIDNFGVSNLFGRENYEYYARISGRVLKVDDSWIFAFRYPRGVGHNAANQADNASAMHDCRSTPTLNLSAAVNCNCSLDDTYARLSLSLEDNMFKLSSNSSSSPSPSSNSQPSVVSVILHHQQRQREMKMKLKTDSRESNRDNSRGEDKSNIATDLDELKSVNRYAESTKSLSFLPIVHERQTQRMKTRSEWFLQSGGLGLGVDCDSGHCDADTDTDETLNGGDSDTKSGQQLIRRQSSKEKRIRRASNKENDDNDNDNDNGNGKQEQEVEEEKSSSNNSFLLLVNSSL